MVSCKLIKNNKLLKTTLKFVRDTGHTSASQNKSLLQDTTYLPL